MKSTRDVPTKNVCNRLPLETIAKLHWLSVETDKLPSAVIRELIDQAEPTHLRTVHLGGTGGTPRAAHGGDTA